MSNQETVKHLDLFSGIGGFALAAQMVGGIETVGFCEIDPWARKVLAKNFPGVPCHEDVKTLDPKNYGTIDLITGGYPCQPFSLAGKRGGEDDDRHLWPEVRRIIEAARPRWVLCENVIGHVTLGLDTVLDELDGIGYTSRPLVVPACAVGAVHRRDRVWIIAHRNGAGLERAKRGGGSGAEGQPLRHLAQLDPQPISGNAKFSGLQGSGGTVESVYSAPQENRQTDRFEHELGWPTVAPVRGADDGLSRRMDSNRLRGLGNAIVPQVAAEILHCMMTVDKNNTAAKEI